MLQNTDSTNGTSPDDGIFDRGLCALQESPADSPPVALRGWPTDSGHSS